MVTPTLFLKLALALAAHPLHTSFAELNFDPRTKTVQVSLRVFVDDYSAAAAAWARRSVQPKVSPLIAYATSSFTLRDANGRAVSLQSCGDKRVGDLMWLCLRGAFTGNPEGSRIVSRILFERFDDQVNIVQASYNGRKSNLLFTSGDKEKRIP